MALAAGSVAALTCGYPEPGGVPSQVGGTEPEIRVGLAEGADRVVISADSEITVLTPNGSPIGGAPPSNGWTVVPDAGALAVVSPTGWRSAPFASLSFAATSPAAPLVLDGRAYRGRLVVLRDPSGITAFNRVGMEAYLAGVVSAEMGRRDPSENEALAAQAVVSRTFAIKNLGKRRSEGFDLYATVVDQVYGGIESETPQSWQAVRETAGRVLTYQHTPIDAFFFSTCGGRTAAGTEVFANADRPYLRSIRDVDDQGQAYCRLSPRFRWEEEWTGDQLASILQQTLPADAPGFKGPVDYVRDVRVTGRTGSDRVSAIAIAMSGQEVTVNGPAVRRVLRPVGDLRLLRSATFTLTVTSTDGRLTNLRAEGSGSGHGVGFCQWGAVGRARAGQNYSSILVAYFPGTEIERLY